MNTNIMSYAYSIKYVTKVVGLRSNIFQIRRHKIDFINDKRFSLRPTKYTTFDVVENMLKNDSTDLCTGILLARPPLCVTRKKEDCLPHIDQDSICKNTQVKQPTIHLNNGSTILTNSIDCQIDTSSIYTANISEYNNTSKSFILNDTSSSNKDNVNDNDDNNKHSVSNEDEFIHIRKAIEIFRDSNKIYYNSQSMCNPFRMPYDTTFLFVKSKILFPDEWYIPTIFVSRYMNIHDAANFVINDILNLNNKATISSPFPSLALIENIPSTHPLYEKLKKKVHVFVYRAIFHGYQDLKYDTDIIQDIQWLTSVEAKSILKPSLYNKLMSIF